ncbi:pirin family protein [Corynebacterium coyleae]
MSSVESNPERSTEQNAAHTPATVEVIHSREVPLGGPRAMTVHRTIPHRQRPLIGAWCFVDHYGPDDVAMTGGMDVAPHPHIGLQTVSWLFEGEIEHIDSGGGRGLVLPGEVNLMTSGDGICHSETSTPNTTVLHGVQLWVALPEGVRREAKRAFEHFVPPEVQLTDDATLRVFLGELEGQRSPVATHSPLLGAQLHLAPGAEVTLTVDPEFEHGVLADAPGLHLEDTELPAWAIGYTGVGETQLRVANTSDEWVYALVIGGTPFEEEIVMWWNFVARDFEEVKEARAAWQERTDRFGEVDGYMGHGGPGKNRDGMSWLPAPELPNGVIRPRRNPDPVARKS